MPGKINVALVYMTGEALWPVVGVYSLVERMKYIKV
jgi:hypothetical protein